jgi:hypothetical protein
MILQGTLLDGSEMLSLDLLEMHLLLLSRDLLLLPLVDVVVLFPCAVRLLQVVFMRDLPCYHALG